MTAQQLCWGPRAAEIACTQIGLGEEGGNNRGRHVRRWCGRDRVYWCAGFLSWCLEQAEPPPGSGDFRSLGARRLYRQLKWGGQELELQVQRVRMGDVALWQRGRLPGWQAHIGIVISADEAGVFTTVEGNVGRYPARVQQVVHDIFEPRLIGVLRLPCGQPSTQASRSSAAY